MATLFKDYPEEVTSYYLTKANGDRRVAINLLNQEDPNVLMVAQQAEVCPSQARDTLTLYNNDVIEALCHILKTPDAPKVETTTITEVPDNIE